MALTYETMRADVAKLIHEDPEEIGPDDNLMDLGLDSMRAMNLVLRWSDAGLALDFSELAEEVTLAGWWKIVERRQAKQA